MGPSHTQPEQEMRQRAIESDASSSVRFTWELPHVREPPLRTLCMTPTIMYKKTFGTYKNVGDVNPHPAFIEQFLPS